MKRLSVMVMIIAVVGIVSCGEFFSDMGIKASLNDGLVGYFPLIGTAADQKDYSGYGNDIHFNNTYSFTSGKFDTACSFGYNGSAISSAISNIKLSPNNSVSVTCWVNLTNAGYTRTLITRIGFFGLQLNNNSLTLECFITLGSAATSEAINFGSWQYITGTFDGRVLRLYINGDLVSEALATNSPGDPTPIDIGPGAGGGGNPMDIDEIRIYNRALSQDEIKELMGMGM